MKKAVVLLILTLAFISCTNQYEKTLGDYFQINGNVKSDLNFELLSCKNAGYITASDSLKEIQNILDSYTKSIEDEKERMSSFNNILNQYNGSLDKAIKSGSSKSNKNDLISKIESTNKNIELCKKRIEQLDKNRNLENDVYDYYSNMNANKKLMEIVECTYKIFNPSKLIMEEITEKYAFSLDKKQCKEYYEIKDNEEIIIMTPLDPL